MRPLQLYQEMAKMGEQQPMNQPINRKKNQAVILGLIGIILALAGVGIIAVPNVLRGSGLGTISLVLGILILVLALFRFSVRR